MSAIGSVESVIYQVLYYNHKVRTKRGKVRGVGVTSGHNIEASQTPVHDSHLNDLLCQENTGLLKMIVGVLTTCLTQYT
jgi:hypothetical protein